MDAGVVTGRAAPGELGVAAGDGDGAAALDLGDLPGDLSDGAGGGGDHYRLAFAGGAGVEQREIGGEARHAVPAQRALRSEEHTSELQSLMRISYAVFCLNKKKTYKSTS